MTDVADRHPRDPDYGTLRHRRGVLSFADRPAVMAVLNVTPDSFSDGGRFDGDAHAAVEAACVLAGNGADIIDVGGESTRPNAEPVSLDEELRRVIPVIRGIRERSEVLVSIDTYKAEVARQAVEAGADIVNDISAGLFDADMLATCAELDAGVVLMHTPARPDAMNGHVYADLVNDVVGQLRERRDAALAAGIAPDRIALDPGFGFGKSAQENFQLATHLDAVLALGHPLLVGVSRKRMIRHAVGDVPADADVGTVAMHATLLRAGAAMVRAHDARMARVGADIEAAFRQSLR